MSLGDFNNIYRCYHEIVKRDWQQVYGHSSYQEFTWQPYRLLEAYALAQRSIENKSVLYTSLWERQTGASTTAMSIVMASENVYMLVSDTRKANAISTKIFRTFDKQGSNIHSHVRPNSIHNRVWWMSGLEQCSIGHRPELIVVDSETAYRKDRDQAIEDLHRFSSCPVLVLDAPRPDWLI